MSTTGSGNIFDAANKARADFLESLDHPSENIGTDLLWRRYLAYRKLCAQELRKHGADDYPIQLED